MAGRQSVIRGGLVLEANGRVALQDLLIEDGRILAIANLIQASRCPVTQKCCRPLTECLFRV